MTALKKSYIHQIQEEASQKEVDLADVFELEESIQAEGSLVFKKPPYYEQENKNFTRITVVDSVGEKEIEKHELKQYIAANKKINKIVIEEVKLDNLKRTNLYFDQKKKVPVKEIPHIDVNSLEKDINKDFLNGSSLSSSHILKSEFEEAFASLGGPKKCLQEKSDERKSERIKESPVKAKLEIVEEVTPTKVDKPFLELSLDNTDEEVKQAPPKIEAAVRSNLSIVDDNNEEITNITVNRHKIKRKNNKALSKIYYKVNNHIELFKLGDSYLKDFNRGIKSIAFNSTGIVCEREKTVLGVTSFLNYNAKVTVTVVTDNLKKSAYQTHIQGLEEIQKPVLGEDFSYQCYATQGVEFVEFSELCNVMYQLDNLSFEEFVEQFIEGADVVLWDLPELKELNNKKELFYPIVRSVESVSLIVKKNFSSYKELHGVKDYFDKYKVPLKGLVLATA